MAKTVTASIVVQFDRGADSSAVMIVEIDDREIADGGTNGGKTTFLPGDDVNLLLYKNTTVVVDGWVPSLGSLNPVSYVPIAIQKTEDIVFAGETEVNVRYPVLGNFSYQWVGANLGAITVVNENTVRVPEPAAGTYAVGVARVSYTTYALVYKLSHSDPGLVEYSIVAFFAGHEP